LHRRELEEFDLLDQLADAARVEQLAVDWEAAEPAVEIPSAVQGT
jgi:hypothetical protein